MPDITPEPIYFSNSQGHNLFGIYHSGKTLSRSSRKTAIILLSPGVKMRVAPHRLYNLMADHFSSLGFSVLRFDFWGLGDSEGECPEEFLADLYGHVQVGRYIKDTICAMNWLSSIKGYDRFVLGGLCGGAITGLLAGAEDNRCVGLLSIGIPVILDSSTIDKAQYMTEWQRITTRNQYLKKLLSPKAWWRLITLKSNFNLISKSFSPPKKFDKNSGELQRNNSIVKSDVNPLFAPKFFDFLERGSLALLIFSGKDRLVHEYEEKFEDKNRDRLKMFKNTLTLHTIPNANHILSNQDWKDEMLTHSGNWLNHFE